MTSFLPGICCRMGKLACADLNTSIVDMALKVYCKDLGINRNCLTLITIKFKVSSPFSATL